MLNEDADHSRSVVAYFRVSTQLQGLDGFGMAAQRDAVSAFASRNGFPIVATYEEVETGRRDDLKNRPALVAAVAHARRSGALLVIARLDRLARSVFVTSQLLKSGVEFVACDNPHANRMTIQMLAVMAEHEGRLISERTKAGLAAARARGVVLGCPHHLDADARRKGQVAAAASHARRAREAYADLVPLIAQWCAEPATLAEMARRLNALGHCTQRRMPWSVPAVRRLLDREGLAGSYAFPGKASHMTPEMRAQGVEAANRAMRARSSAADAAVIDRVLALYHAGESCGEIAQRLNSEGSRVWNGSRWSYGTVSRVLQRAKVPIQTKPSAYWSVKNRHASVAGVKARAAKYAAFRETMVPIVTELRDRGLTYAQIATNLNRRRRRTANGQRWTSASVWTLLNR